MATLAAAAEAAAVNIAADEDGDTSDVVVDDPCWGSAQECSLAHLLRRIDRSRVVRYVSENYIVIDKPPDLRMDGPFPATVHKLLLYWFGIRAAHVPGKQSDATGTDPSEAAWLDYVAAQHRHSHRDPHGLRPCHQLDYATSGALLVARHRGAADRARRAFEERRVTKRYEALLWGHVRLSTDWPVLPRRQLEETLAALERAYRATRKRRRRDTWNGYQPPHALFQQWVTQRRKQAQDLAGKAPNHGKSLTADDWSAVWAALELDGEAATTALESLNWAQLKAINQAQRFERAAAVYNQLAREKMRAQSDVGGDGDGTNGARPVLPTFFRVQETMDTQTFYIFAPLAQASDDFRMRLPASLDDLVTDNTCNVPTVREDEDGWDFKPSLTECKIASHSHLLPRESEAARGLPVTRMSLAPLTGRRHQLRVHAALLGHAIVGDQTYQSKTRGGTNPCNELVDRMCLHSASLKIPFLENDTDCFHVEAGSPFVESDDGITIRLI